MISFDGYSQKQSPKGSLFIIGGGIRSQKLINKMIETANFLPNDYIVVLPMATQEPDTAFKYIDLQFKAATDKKVINLDFDSISVNDSQKLSLLYSAKLIYIPGGDQNRFMNVVLNTKVYDAIHFAYQNGSTIAGTSAGAAVMSKYMITGKQLQGDTTYKETFNKLWKNNTEFQEGLGLLDSVIIDQHFIKRSRYNRLISALEAKPNFDCIGIDESTALIVHQNTASISGESQVIKFSNMETDGLTGDEKLIKFKDVKMSIYTNGDKFVIK
ncbi:cyanophycinase [Pedobacter psychrophilus]|uniref:Cyanophycinase n=1 Tax=Pedobacter psychrophilus TaxID=1826909 RepID=A0A179DDF5_9SPHI|nr:cyanophycinase [Pedobacter psychrophilus]